MARLRKFNDEVLKMINETAEYIENYYDIDLGDTKKTNELVAIRALFFYIVYEKYNVNDRLIADWLEENRGLRKNRSTIWFAINKIDEYLINFEYIRDTYDYFMDNGVVHATNLPKSVVLSEKIIDVVKDIPPRRVDEIVEVINLRKKSWEWKSKDKCEIINCQA